jgi:hypothetical protein
VVSINTLRASLRKVSDFVAVSCEKHWKDNNKSTKGRINLFMAFWKVSKNGDEIKQMNGS